jgi:hypothetical protein
MKVIKPRETEKLYSGLDNVYAVNSWTRLILFFFIILLPVSVFAQAPGSENSGIDCSIPKIFKTTRPDSEGIKTPVKIGLYIIDIKGINDVEQTFKADVFINVSWRDPRLSENSLGRSLEECVFTLKDLWNPPFFAVNRNSGGKLLDDIVTVDAEGNVNYKQHYVGELSADLLFAEFPFDKQLLHFNLMAYGPDAGNIVFEVDYELTGTRDKFSIEGWSVEFLDAIVKSESITTIGSEKVHNFARVDFRLSAHRDKNYYLWKVITPLCLIVLMAWAVFWIDPSHFGPQIGLSTATVFTLIAYRFSLGFTLPKVSYFTRIDEFILFSTILVFLALGTAITTGKITTDGNKELAQKIESWARYIYIILFLIILVFTLWF